MPIGTLRVSHPPWDMKRQLLVCMLFSIVMLAMTACGQNTAPQTSRDPLADPRNLATPASADGRFSVDAPPALRGENVENTGPFAEVKPLEIRQGGSLGALGLNFDTYFAGDIGDTNARVDRIEAAVTAMQKDLKTLAPSLQRLALIEGDLQDLVGQLEALLQEENAVAPAEINMPVQTSPVQTASPEDDALQGEEPAPPDEIAEAVASSAPLPMAPAAAETQPAEQPPSAAPATPAITPPASPPAPAPVSAPVSPSTPATEGPQVAGLRFGIDNAKTRIVFDANRLPVYRYDLDNTENLLVLELSQTAWNAPAQGKAPAGSLIDTWTSQSDGAGGTRVIMTLKKPASIVYEGVIKPESGYPHHRLVLDLGTK